MSPTPPEYILHIGLHKTGTTSFQAVMHNHRAAFLAQGIDPFQTPRGISSGRAKHGDLAFAAMRSGVLDQRPGDLLHGVDQQALFESTRAAIASHVAASTCTRFLFSTEALSLLRTPDELSRLKALFPPGPATFSAVLALREKEAWLASYTNHMVKSGVTPATDPASAYYLRGDNWLTDFDGLVATWRAGCDSLVTLHYDPEDMVGNLAGAMGVTLDFNTRAYRRNVSPRNPHVMRLPRLILRRVLGSEDEGLRRRLRAIRERWTL
ncbi:MAG: hypothetical protein GC146_15930 [Limimaricola sp.]|uniref:hypothetical protein n=1 Tax=Limimaricola sp. TaxID=2211665 RepID=UPI001D483AD2|nr:hypothetical protein [Limimaricola sp.]MBI1418705.1 hypothetical protein [Limimaricola sp.]